MAGARAMVAFIVAGCVANRGMATIYARGVFPEPREDNRFDLLRISVFSNPVAEERLHLGSVSNRLQQRISGVRVVQRGKSSSHVVRKVIELASR